jgi:hypothetical protein
MLALPTFYFLWLVTRRLASIGFFVFYALIGIALAYAGLWTVEVPTSLAAPYAIVAGFAFASVCATIRARIARLVGILFIVAMVAMLGWKLY